MGARDREGKACATEQVTPVGKWTWILPGLRGSSEERPPRVTPPNDEEAGLFIHQLWLVVGRRLLPRVAPISSSLPHSRTDTAQWQKETLRHKDLGSGRWRSELRALRG